METVYKLDKKMGVICSAHLTSSSKFKDYLLETMSMVSHRLYNIYLIMVLSHLEVLKGIHNMVRVVINSLHYWDVTDVIYYSLNVI